MVAKNTEIKTEPVTIDIDECKAFFFVGLNVVHKRSLIDSPQTRVWSGKQRVLWMAYPSMNGLVSAINIMATFGIDVSTVLTYQYRQFEKISKEQFILHEQESGLLRQMNGGK